MAKIDSLEVEIRSITKYHFVFIPLATLTKVAGGEIQLLTVFGVPIYKKVGEVRALFGFIF